MKSRLSFRTLVWAALTVACAVAYVVGLASLLPAGFSILPTESDAGASIMAAGMLVNKENLNNLFISLKAIFNKAFDAAPSTWEKIAMKVPSTTGQTDYAWLSKFPKMRKWIGEKTIKALEAFKYVIVNDDFEATVEVDRNDIDDDNLGIYQPQAKGAGQSAKQWPDELVSDAANGAFTTPCYDGQYFIDTDHPVRKADGTVVSVSNKGTKKLSVASLAAVQGSIGAAETAMMEFTDDEGRPLGVVPNVLMVPPALKATANTLVTTDRLEDGKPNPYKGAFEVVVNTRLTSRTAWFLLDTTKAVMPFVFQERKAPEFVQQIDLNSDTVFMRRKYRFGAEARGAAGYTFWQLVYGSDGTVD